VKPLTPAAASARSTEVLARVSEAVVGNDEPLRLILSAFLAGGHVLVQDLPGLGKTLTARSFAQALGLGFGRVQFTPDLLPADITGSFVYDPREATFEFRPGPVFTQLLLADEINRTPPRTQAALLEAMQEGQVTVEGETYALPEPFLVIATANPLEYEGTYQLPEAQLDRFLLQVSFGYLAPEQERDVLERRLVRRQESQQVAPVVDSDTVLAMQAAVERVSVEASVGDYVMDLVLATRQRPEVLVGASPRGGLALLLCSRAYAVVDGRTFVSPEDVKAVAGAALAHRLTLRPEALLSGVTAPEVVRRVLTDVPVPPTAQLPRHRPAPR
jgi:MoxR-like ATPase